MVTEEVAVGPAFFYGEGVSTGLLGSWVGSL